MKTFETIKSVTEKFYVPFEKQLNDIPDIYKVNESQPLMIYIKRPKVSCSNGILVSLIKCARYDFEQREWIRDYYSQMSKKEIRIKYERYIIRRSFYISYINA